MRYGLKLGVIGLAVLCLAPSRRAELDHVGAYNFMVEISGTAAGYFKSVDGLQAVFEASNTGRKVDSEIRFNAGRTKTDRARVGDIAPVRIRIILQKPALDLPKGRVCTIELQARVAAVSKNGMKLIPEGPAKDDCAILRRPDGR